ncbi:MAG: acetolactate decarboxylase [Legionella sp.]|jgi:acetolactate decarboxylase|nr:acetolactate decarboxylase [Legionella sp.]
MTVHHHTLFQLSTSAALVQGVYQGCATVAHVKTQGDFGLGTYEALNGEGLMLDGHVFQARSDGVVVEPDDASQVPFWVSTWFVSDRAAKLSKVSNWDELCSQINKLRRSDNLFYAIRIEGVFERILYRVACQSSPGTDLVSATNQQAEFRLEHVEGTLLGFWSPEYAKSFNIPGYHLHFLSSNHQHAGHVLDISGKNLKLKIMDINKMMITLPESDAFLHADLSIDPAEALSQAEGGEPRNSPAH